MACQIATRMTMLKKGQVCSGATWWILICLVKMIIEQFDTVTVTVQKSRNERQYGHLPASKSNILWLWIRNRTPSGRWIIDTVDGKALARIKKLPVLPVQNDNFSTFCQSFSYLSHYKTTFLPVLANFCQSSRLAVGSLAKGLVDGHVTRRRSHQRV